MNFIMIFLAVSLSILSFTKSTICHKDLTDDGRNPPKTLTQENAPWNLLKTTGDSNHPMPITNSFTTPDYCNKNIKVYVIDSGSRVTHEDFEGRVTEGPNHCIYNENGEDNRDHGTCITSIIAGKTYGMVKTANVESIKIINKNGDSNSPEFVKALKYVQTDHLKRLETDPESKSILNLI
jgi:Subtilase family